MLCSPYFSVTNFNHVAPVCAAIVRPSKSLKSRTGEAACTMMACGSCCMVAAIATSGSPFEFHSRTWSLDPSPMSILPEAIICAALPYCVSGAIDTSSPSCL